MKRISLVVKRISLVVAIILTLLLLQSSAATAHTSTYCGHDIRREYDSTARDAVTVIFLRHWTENVGGYFYHRHRYSHAYDNPANWWRNHQATRTCGGPW